MHGYGGPGPQGQNWPPNPYGAYPPPPPKAGAGSVIWALAPLFTCGFAAPFTIGYAAVRRRSALLGATAALYASGIVAWMSIVDAYDDQDRLPAGPGILMVAGMLGPWLGATVHSLIIRERVFGPPPPRMTSGNEQAIAMAQHRRTLRQQARELAGRDPLLAHDLRIGRPDLPRQYDDGGLVDLNHAPVEVIAGLPGMTLPLARQVVAARDSVGGFVSAEDVAAAASLPPHLTPELAEYTIYLS
ncbi:ComEA family DNA-binding protein [Microbispora sp. ATCC PTA-5024]|uniref:ComEA family DNA-binding protein n=1 Tax=Microbispora sp. ATCC PTA-5024 TaxID=316330 RepID=UPI0003DC1F38|nr:helix-hairpin-helix domain-containing protein [Microbispora sp. ATCC PTA-5024]ETK34275.1 hypothetical protein MPTA5024_20240 [Microbispora sp. ATCC PTA-5024]